MFPNFRIAAAPAAAMKIRVIGFLLLLCGLNSWIGSEFRNLPTYSPTGAVTEDFQPGLGSSLTRTVADAVVVLNLSPGWLEHLPRVVCQFTLLAIMCTVVSSFSAKRMFRNESCSILQCLRLALKSWRSLLQAIAIGGCLVILCRVSLWLMIALASLVNFSAFFVPAGMLAFMTLGGLSLLSVALGCVAVGYDDCSGAEGVSRGLSYVLSRPGTTVLMLLCTVTLSWLTNYLAITLLQLFRYEFTKPTTPWNASILMDAIHMGIWSSGIAIMYIRLRDEVDGVPEAEVSR
jgi:hypothetical protein